MSSFILTLLVAAVAAAVVELLTPRGDGGRIAAHVRMIAGLFLLVALLEPLREGMSLLSSAVDGTLGEDILGDILPDYTPTDYESTFYDSLNTHSAAEWEAWVITTLSAEFDIPSDECRVAVTCDTAADPPTLSEVRIALGGRSIWQDPHVIEAFFEERLDCPCFVTVTAGL